MSSTILGIIPCNLGSCRTPSIVCVFPDDVCPYANMVPLKPAKTSLTIGSAACSYTFAFKRFSNGFVKRSKVICEHHFENLPVLLILEIRDRSYMFYRRTYLRFQMFKKFACKPLTIGDRTFITSSLRLVSETNFGKNLSPLSISFEFRGRNRHITFIVTASAISISQILEKNL